MKLSSLRVNSTQAEQGAWVGDIPEMEGLAVKVRGFGNRDYRAFVAAETAKVSRDGRDGGRRDGAIKPDIRDAIMARGMHAHILLDWRGLTDDDGTDIPYTADQAMTLLSDPDLRPFRDAVAYAANIVEEIRSDAVEAVAGNSARASGGTSTGAPSSTI